MDFEPVIGLEIHAELQTRSKMFCACPVVDVTQATPNIAVCPICSGMPGVLPVINQKAIDFALRVALALECEIQEVSIFARKNYFYPDLPKGYQISQYEQPLARNGNLTILTSQGARTIRIRRVHIEEDTGKLTHIHNNGESYSLVDLNRAGVPLLEIVSEPDMHSVEEVRAYATAMRSLLRYLNVSSGDMQKGVMRIEPNVSVRPVGADKFGTRTEIKNLNSFRSLEHSVDFEINRQIELLKKGLKVKQETRGWNESLQESVTQRSKEEAEGYRYFPEPDLPPLVIDKVWLDKTRGDLPELPIAKFRRFQSQYDLSAYDSSVLTVERMVADYFEQTVSFIPDIKPKIIVNWIIGELFGQLNQANMHIEDSLVTPQALAELILFVSRGDINKNTAKAVLSDMFESGQQAKEIILERSLQQVSDSQVIAEIIKRILTENPEQIQSYLEGNQKLSGWFFGQIMQVAKGQANPQIVQQELKKQLKDLEEKRTV